MRYLLLLWLSLTAVAALGQSSQHHNLDRGVALHGYDPVAYLDERQALRGRKEFTASYNGATYQFATAAHRATFQANPAKYEPAYGGWCAYAMGNSGEKVDFDPKTFKIVNGRLYLFYNAFFTNTLPLWNQDEARLKTAADANWKRLTGGQ